MHRLKPYLKARTVEELWALHTAQMGQIGFDHLIYANTFFQTRTLPDPRDTLILTNHRPDYVTQFVDHGMFRDAPMTNWAANNVGSKTWREMGGLLKDGAFTEKERKVVEFNRRYGLVAGVTISFPSRHRRGAAGIGLCARPGLTHDDVDRIWTDHGEEIEILNYVAHLCICQLPAIGQRRVLTDRQIEVLELVSDGKTVQDIAVMLGRNVATIEKHLRGARDALDVGTTAQAVHKAVLLNQIFMIDPGV